MPAGEAAHNSVQPAGLLMQLRYAIWSFSADVQAVSSAVPPQPPVYAVPMAPTLIRKPHSPALLSTLLRHRNAHRPGSKKTCRVQQQEAGSHRGTHNSADIVVIRPHSVGMLPLSPLLCSVLHRIAPAQ
jgi:hypothetical protein